jgi:hypothetical protein
MSLHEYRVSAEIARLNFPFYALVMAAMRQADDRNLAALRAAFPNIWTELDTRYNAPGGLVPEERQRTAR